MKPFKWKCIFLNNRNSNVLGVIIVIAFSRAGSTLGIQVRAKDEQPWIICPPWASCRPYASVPPSTPWQWQPCICRLLQPGGKQKDLLIHICFNSQQSTLVSRSNTNGMNAFFPCSQACLKTWQISGRWDLCGTRSQRPNQDWCVEALGSWLWLNLRQVVWKWIYFVDKGA